MLWTNYRCVQSTNISLDVAKCGENFHKFTHCTPFSSVTKKWLVLTENIYAWSGFNWLGCPLMLRTNYRCVQSSNITVYVAKCGDNFHKFIQYTHYFSVTKNVLSLLSLVVAWRGENFNKFTLYTHYFSVTKNDLSWINNLFMVRTHLITMSSNAKNKLQMCSVNQHQFRCRQMCGKFSQIHPVHSPFVRYKKGFVLTELSIHGKELTY